MLFKILKWTGIYWLAQKITDYGRSPKSGSE